LQAESHQSSLSRIQIRKTVRSTLGALKAKNPTSKSLVVSLKSLGLVGIGFRSEYKLLRIHLGLLHFQFRISGMSWPY
jgi:hypothetical protein